MRKKLFNNVVIVIGLYVGIEIFPLIDATEIFIFKIKSTFKN